MKFQKDFKVIFFLIAMLLSANFAAAQTSITKPYNFSAGTTASSSQVNANFDALYKKINELSAEIANLKAGSLPAPNYDSGWFNISKNSTKTLSHNMGAAPKLAIIWGSVSGSDTNKYLMDGHFSDASGTIGCWLRKITATSCEVASGTYAAASNINVGNTGNTSTYIKVLMWK